MSAKAKAISAVTLLLMMAVTLGACAPNHKVQLLILREAPDFTLTNQDGLDS